MSKIRLYDPAKTFCRHNLVPPGRTCPQCCWDAAASGDDARGHLAIRKTYLQAMLLACEAMLPRELRPRVREEERRGPWYALQFTVRWKTGQRKELIA